jgi:uncharacterized protein
MDSYLPHSKSYVRLKPSEIPDAGVGVFAIVDIPKDVIIFQFDNSEINWIKEEEIKNLPPEIQEMYRHFSVEKDGMLGAPKHFNQMTPAWYINHSKNPNCGCNDEYDFYTLRDIKKGEELTVDYSTYGDDVEKILKFSEF